MDATVFAAYIAAGASLFTLAGTTISQRNTSRATSKDNEKTLEQQREQSEKSLEQQRDQLYQTLAEQREQLDRTLAEQREQLDKTLEEQSTRTLNERFATAAEQLGGDKPPAVQLAGVYAMAVLADDWVKNRQTCVDVLCAYLRMPYEPDPGAAADAKEQRAFRASREVRHTVIRVITTRLREGAAVPWQDSSFDFTGVVFDGADFTGAVFSGGRVSFTHANFSGGKVDFSAKFSGSDIRFWKAEFTGAEVSFVRAGFSRGDIGFGSAVFSGGTISFQHTRFSGSDVYFSRAEFSGSDVDFSDAKFSSGTVMFDLNAKFSSGKVSFHRAEFTGTEVDFRGEYPDPGFGARFSGGDVDFSHPADWSSPPAFPWTNTPPPGVTLPTAEEQSRRKRKHA